MIMFFPHRHKISLLNIPEVDADSQTLCDTATAVSECQHTDRSVILDCLTRAYMVYNTINARISPFAHKKQNHPRKPASVCSTVLIA